MMDGQSDSIVLEEEIDPNYEPTEKEVLEYATWLGMDLEAERDLFWIAREGLKAPLPENWKPCKTTDTEEIYYFNFATGQSTWDHPCDEFYRNLYEEHKMKHQSNNAQETDEKKKKAKEDVAELLGKKGGGKKKKKAALAKAEPLGPPLLGKANPLEKKPLPGLTGGRLGALGLNGGLKAANGLGPLRSDAKDLGGPSVGLDSADDDVRGDRLAKPLSRTPLGGVLGKKSLLSSSSMAEAKQGLDLNQELRSERLKHEEKQRELQEELARLEKKLEASLEDRKEAVDLTTALKGEVEQLRERQKELEKELKAVRDEKDSLLRDKNRIGTERDQFQRDVDELSRQLALARESISQSGDVEEQLRLLKQQLSAARSEVATTKDQLNELHDQHAVTLTTNTQIKEQLMKESNERKLLREQLDSKSEQAEQHSTEVEKHRQQIQRLQNELERESQSRQGLQYQLDKESHSLKHIQNELENELQSRQDLEKACDKLRAELEVAKSRADSQVEQLNSSNTRSDLEIQKMTELEQLSTELKAEVGRLKEQLTRELNEKELLIEQLDSKSEQEDQHWSTEIEKHRQQLQKIQNELEKESQSRQDLQNELAKESQSRQDLEEACDKLRAELEVAKSRLDSQLEQLNSSNTHSDLEAEKMTELEHVSTELKAEVERLKGEYRLLENENRALLRDKEAVEMECNRTRQDVIDLRQQLSLKQEANDLAKYDRERSNDRTMLLQEKESAARSFREQEDRLKAEITVLQENMSQMEKESRELKAQCDSLLIDKKTAAESSLRALSSASSSQDQVKSLEQQLAIAQAELANTRSEMRTLQDQCTKLTSTNAKVEEQLLKESNEKKLLREQVDSNSEHAEQNRSTETEKHRQQVQRLQNELENESQSRQHLQNELEKESQSRQGLEKACDKLGVELEVVKSRADSYLEQLNNSSTRSDQKTTELERVSIELKVEVGRLKGEYSLLEKENSALLRGKEAVEMECNRARQDVTELRQQLKLKQESVDQAKADRERSTATLMQEKESAARSFREQEDRLKKEITALQEKLSKREAAISDLKAQCYSLEQLDSRSRETRREQEDSCDTLRRELTAVQRQLEKESQARRDQENQSDLELEQVRSEKRRLESERSSLSLRLEEMSASRRHDEVEHANVLHSKDRAEMQLQSKEKALTAAQDELARRKAENETLQARVKSLLSDKEEAQAALLNANIVNVSAAASRGPATSIGESADVMLVKLQLADANKNELELHLADISAQLEDVTRQNSALEGRCRDQALQIESFHVEVASLRSVTQKMHASALESLSLVERLEYEHKKRTLRSDFLTQLRDFQEREEQALIRNKARLHAQHERRLEDLVAELEKIRQHRVEQEEAVSTQTLEHIRQERDVKRNDAKRKVREELTRFEQDLHERKEREIAMISKAIEREESELGARLREARQVSREEELANGKGIEHVDTARASTEGLPPGSPGQVYCDHTARQTKTNNDPHDSVKAERTDRQSKKHMRAYQKWKRRLQEEVDLLTDARMLVANQRQGLMKQAQQLKSSKSAWKRNSRSAQSSPAQNEVKRMLDENVANWSEGMRKLREQEAWVKHRERKLANMGRTVKRLRSKRKGSGVRNNNSSSGSSSEGEENDGNWSDDSNQSEFVSTLERLERLEEELASDAGSFSEGQLPEFDRGLQMYPLQREVSYRYPLASSTGVFTPRRAIHHVPSDLGGQELWWMRSQRSTHGLRDRYAVTPINNSGASAAHTSQVYQRKISRWARGREKVQHAATSHATWLSGLCEELQEYGAKYHRAENEMLAASNEELVRNEE